MYFKNYNLSYFDILRLSFDQILILYSFVQNCNHLLNNELK